MKKYPNYQGFTVYNYMEKFICQIKPMGSISTMGFTAKLCL